jgi:hypothetical protein
MEQPTDFRMAEGRRLLREARSAAFSSRTALAAGDRSAEAHARTALARYASAMNWTEGTAEFEIAHAELHTLGRICRERFPNGCRFTEVDNDFEQRCPAALVHSRLGVQPVIVGNAICSICDSDISECPHRPGHTYPVEAAVHPLGACNVCGNQDCAEHIVGRIYDAEARVSITEVYEFEEVSVGANPTQPDARLTAVRIARKDFEAKLGKEIPAGAHVNCDHCLRECGGFNYFAADDV